MGRSLTSELPKAEALNMRLLAHLDLGGHGNGGEGMALHVARGRRTLYIAHESAPVNFSVVDVSDPLHPRLLAQHYLPHDGVRSNSLAASGDVLAVAYQVRVRGTQPAGLELFDISNPERARPLGYFDTSGPHSRGTHFVWFADGERAYLSTGMPDFVPSHPDDDQIPVVVDVSDPARAVELGRWWLPGTRSGDGVEPPARHPRWDTGFRSHNVNVYPERPDRAYVGYVDGGVVVLDIGDLDRVRVVSRLDYHPPLPGMTHTVLPLFGRGLLAVTDESTVDGGADHPKLLWLMDGSTETNIVPLSSAPLPPPEYRRRGGRYGTHNIHENEPAEGSFRSETTLVGAFFNGGVRAFDISDALQPRLMAYLVPEPPARSPAGAVQINDVYAGADGVVYAVDRFTGGLYIVELTG